MKIKEKYNQEQIKELKRNRYVKNCTCKHLIFTKSCKLKAIELSKQYTTPKEIFTQLWFPDYIVHSKTPSRSITRWKSVIKNTWWVEEKKWRRRAERIDISKMTKDEYIFYLEAKLAIAEELKKLTNWDYP